jgi:hypothetical protein
MIRKTILLLGTIALSIVCGCTTVNYSGTVYSPTKKVDIFYNKNQIKKPYKKMGTATTGTWYTYQRRHLKNAIVAKAKEVGADAILVNYIDAEPTKPARRNSTNDTNSTLLATGNTEMGLHPGQVLFQDDGGYTESMDVSKVSVDFLKYDKK